MNPISEDREKPVTKKEDLKYQLFSMEKRRPIPKQQRQSPQVHLLLAALGACNIFLGMTVYEFVLDYRMGTTSPSRETDQPLLDGYCPGGFRALYGVFVFTTLTEIGMFLYTEIDYLQTKSFRIFRNQKNWRVFYLIISFVFLFIHPIPVRAFIDPLSDILVWDARTSSFLWIKLPLITWALFIQLLSQGVFICLQICDYVYKSNKLSVKSSERWRYPATYHFLIQVFPLRTCLGLGVLVWVISAFTLRSFEFAGAYYFNEYLDSDAVWPSNLATFSNSFFYVFGVLLRLSAWNSWPSLNVSRFFVYFFIILTAFWWGNLFVGIRNLMKLGPMEQEIYRKEQAAGVRSDLRESANLMIISRYRARLAERKGDLPSYRSAKGVFDGARLRFRRLQTMLQRDLAPPLDMKNHLMHLDAQLEAAVRLVERENPQSVARAKNDLTLRTTKNFSQN